MNVLQLMETVPTYVLTPIEAMCALAQLVMH